MTPEELRDYLDENGLSVLLLAELTKINPSAIHHWLAGTRSMSAASEQHLLLLEAWHWQHGTFPAKKRRPKHPAAIEKGIRRRLTALAHLAPLDQVAAALEVTAASRGACPQPPCQK